MSQTSVTSQSTWRSKIKAMGPGILMASAAVGGSHIVSSTQAGGSYGTFCVHSKSSIIPTVVLPTTEIIEPK